MQLLAYLLCHYGRIMKLPIPTLLPKVFDQISLEGIWLALGGHISTLSQVTAEDNRITNVAQSHIQKCHLSYIALSIHLVPTLLQGTSWKVVVLFFFFSDHN